MKNHWTICRPRIIINDEGGVIMPKIDAQLGIRVTKDLKARLTAQAKSEMKSVSALVVQVVEEYFGLQRKWKK